MSCISSPVKDFHFCSPSNDSAMGNHRMIEVFCSAVSSTLLHHEIFLINSFVVSQLAHLFQLAWLLLLQLSEDTIAKFHNHLT